MRRAAVAVVLLVALGWILLRGEPAAGPPTGTAPPATAASAPTAIPSPTDPPTPSPTPGSEHAWEPTVHQFATRYASPGRDVRAWAAGLKPYVTPAVYDELRNADAAAIPRGHYDSAELLEATNTRVSAEVTYTEGWSVVVYLRPGGRSGRWLVTAYDALDEEDAD